MEYVDLSPFRARYEELLERGQDAPEIARRMDFLSRGRADTARLRRTLGLVPMYRCKKPNTHVTYDTAVRLCEALEMDPVDAGV